MKAIILFFTVQILTAFISEAQISNGINFQSIESWENVLAKAATENKLILVDAYTTWCGPCKEMDARTYPDSMLGLAINSRFIAVKVQIDKSITDNAFIRSWYLDADKIKTVYQLDAFPSLLFLSASGELLMKSVGFKEATAVNTIARFVSNVSAAEKFNNELKAYRNGKLNFHEMAGLSRTVFQIVGDKGLALQIAKDFKENYLEKQQDNEYFNEDNVRFINEYGIDIVSVSDRFFNACYNNPKLIDQILGHGAAEYYVSSTISKNEIHDKIVNADKPITITPDWEGITIDIARKYPKVDAKDLVLNQKPIFYYLIKDWDKYTESKSELILVHPPKPGGLEVFLMLNDAAWNVFLNTHEKAALERALAWSNLSLKLESNVQYLDTKANILYKLGHVNEAIHLQEQALAQDREEAAKRGRQFGFGYILENLENMKRGKPTWIQ
jgi:thiol-disulfide isomerase/thioredoxin